GSVPYKNARSKQYVHEENNSYESTPYPTTSIVTNTLIVTSNKPIITNTTFNQYFTHVICVFNATIHLVQQITEKKLYEEIERILQLRNKLVLKDLINKKLE
ncbi:18219_t:CDS:1, partial [Rhizophagus irregularis]